jgi:hypothetical protein
LKVILSDARGKYNYYSFIIIFEELEYFEPPKKTKKAEVAKWPKGGRGLKARIVSISTVGKMEIDFYDYNDGKV